jgi:hypothetical protein
MGPTYTRRQRIVKAAKEIATSRPKMPSPISREQVEKLENQFTKVSADEMKLQQRIDEMIPLAPGLYITE